MEAIKKVHFISVGGSVMHNLAMALHKKGYQVTGSDDEIYEPSKSRLSKVGLLPAEIGWFPEKITPQLDAVILGMHARADNPELLKAKELGIKIYSYPEFIFEQSKNKQRVVIAGSHGKTSITAMILHVLKFHKRKFDYVVGAQLEGFDVMVQLTDDAPLIVIEGDEYVTSALDKSPKFLHYHHHIGLMSGIAWDHINVFPTFDEYVKQFELFADQSPKAGILIFDETDDLASVIGRKERDDVTRIEYGAHKHEIVNGETFLINSGQKIPVKIFGKHNMRNICGAKSVLGKIGVTDEMFYEAITSFQGAANRLELLGKNGQTTIYKDFAHAPSKLEATTKAVKGQFPDRKLTAVLELHTFSSLNKEFLSQYNDTFNSPDEPVIFFDPHTVEHKQLPPISEQEIKTAFGLSNLHVFTDASKLKSFLLEKQWASRNLLLMSSGNFGGINVKELASELISKNNS